jgi:hypothetical protein
LFLLATIPSCELFDDCKTCKQVTYIEGVYNSQTEGKLYCGEGLREIRKTEPVLDGNILTQWECE